MEDEKFDVIIVGAGPAGAASAYILAKNGKSVLLIERGDIPGCKNVTGGRLYTYALEMVEAGLYKEAPLERRVIREQMMFLGSQQGTTVDYYNGQGADAEDLSQSYTVLRGEFDEWFAAKAEEQGAMLACGILVENLLIKDGKVIGVKAGDDEMYADLVIAADGVNSFLAQQAGLKKEWSGHEIGVGVKEIIELSPEKIQQRFLLKETEGAARMILGGSDGVQGGGFLYTNKESVSLGMVLSPEALAKQSRSLADLYQDFKMHPAIYPLIEGGTTVEYSGHLVPENGWNSVPEKLFCDGLLIVGDAAGMVINTGTVIRGMDLAIISGVAAARAILQETDKGKVGPQYIKELEDLHLIESMKLFSGWPQITGMKRMTDAYPEMLNEMLSFMFKVDGNVPEKMTKAMQHIVTQHVGIRHLAADLWRGFRAV